MNKMPEESERKDTETTTEDVGKRAEGVRPKRPYSSANRALTEPELSSPPSCFFLIEDIERLEQEVNELRNYREHFFQSDKENAVLKQKIATFLSIDIVYSVCLAIGAVLLGLIWTFKELNYIIFFGLLALVLIIGAIIAKTVIK